MILWPRLTDVQGLVFLKLCVHIPLCTYRDKHCMCSLTDSYILTHTHTRTHMSLRGVSCQQHALSDWLMRMIGDVVLPPQGVWARPCFLRLACSTAQHTAGSTLSTVQCCTYTSPTLRDSINYVLLLKM